MDTPIGNVSVYRTMQWKKPLWLIRLINYEYWPFWILFFPAFFYWLYLGFKARSLAYFSAANPGIENGGVFGESKSDILKMIPDKYKPASVLVSESLQPADLISLFHKTGFQYPVICKPDKGEMGFKVKRVENESDLLIYLEETPVDFLIQEFITWSEEYGVLYYRLPNGKSGISSLVAKEFLSVTGDGVNTVEELMNYSDRARLQLDNFKREKPALLSIVPDNGLTLQLEPIGNHCRGTKFINANNSITPQMVAVFDTIAKNMDGFNYGRFDLKVKRIDDLYTGENIRIMEVNGCTSEPAHIYGEDMNLWKVYRDIFSNMKIVNQIAIANHKLGYPYVPIRKIVTETLQHFKMKRTSNGK
jgi:hypothetical protein